MGALNVPIFHRAEPKRIKQHELWRVFEFVCWVRDCADWAQIAEKGGRVYVNRERQCSVCVCGEPSQTTKGTAWGDGERRKSQRRRDPFGHLCLLSAKWERIAGGIAERWRFVVGNLFGICQIGLRKSARFVRAQNIKAGERESGRAQQIKKGKSDKRTQNCLVLQEKSLFPLAAAVGSSLIFLVGSGDEFQGAPWCTALPGIVAQKYFIIFLRAQPPWFLFISHRWRTNLRFRTARVLDFH